MKTLFYALALSVICLSLSPTIAAEPASIRATLTLADNSTLKGTVAPETELQGNVAFMDGVKIPLSLIRELTADGTNGAQIATLSNGDKIHFAQTTKTLMVSSVLGDLSIPFANIRKATFSAVSGTGDDGLVFYCNFDSIEDIQKPVVGPAGQITHAEIVKGKVGNALSLPRKEQGVVFPFENTVMGPQGAIDFWARIDAWEDMCTYVGSPVFFTMEFTNLLTLQITYANNNGRGKGGLCASGGGILWDATFGGCRSFPYSEIVHPWKDWHHYVLVWNESGLANNPDVWIALYVDGRLKISRPISEAQVALKTLNLPYTLGFNLKEGTWSNAPFSIDEFKIWNSEIPIYSERK